MFFFSLYYIFTVCVCVHYFICLAKFNKHSVSHPDVALGTPGFMSIRKLIICGENQTHMLSHATWVFY